MDQENAVNWQRKMTKDTQIDGSNICNRGSDCALESLEAAKQCLFLETPALDLVVIGGVLVIDKVRHRTWTSSITM